MEHANLSLVLLHVRVVTVVSHVLSNRLMSPAALEIVFPLVAGTVGISSDENSLLMSVPSL